MVLRWSIPLVFTGLFGPLTFLLVSPPLDAQESVGAKFGSRDPRTCASRTAALSPATAREYFICDQEYVVGPNASGEFIYLVSDVKVELGRSRPFNPDTDTFGFAASNAIDPSQAVVPIRGSFNEWVCGKLGQINAEPGKSCNLTPNLHAVGLCFTNSFGDWHCTMTDLGAAREFLPAHAPPTQP
jgi:hypothetical protein